MTAPRAMIHVQHLLGIGHLKRAAILARGFAEGGLPVDLVSGGMPLATLEIGKARLHQLPPARALDENFARLADESGNPLGPGWQEQRRDALLALFRALRPDILLIEMFPFGRRFFAFELLPLIEAALAARPRPLLAVSVRDILQGSRKPGRAEETAALIARAVDLVLVHGDPRLVRFEESFPLAAELGAKLRYTGYVAEPAAPRESAGAAGWDEVLVSAGGGAVGLHLLETALAARPLTALARAPWRLLAGGNLAEDDFAALASRAKREGVLLERARPDFPRLLANCHVSVSQAGYNSVMDVLNAGARAVLVPFEGAGETEQRQRAERLGARGLARLVAERDLAPRNLAAAIDAAASGPRPDTSAIDRDGAAASLRLLRAELAALRAA
jgi:predicted glycosyltransferase